MGVSNATLNGNRVTSARVSIPAWGCWYADASTDGEQTLTGAVEIKIADLTLKGTVLSGGPAKGRSSFRIVGGKGGWGKTLPKKAYANDLGVKLATVLGDAARECGETIDESTVSSTDRVGPSFVRPAAPASRVLELCARGAWYVAEDGTTRIGARKSSTLTGAVQRIGDIDLARGTLTVAAESIVGIVPGVTIDGLTAVDVEHSISAKKGLRSTIWGKRPTTPMLAAFRAMLDQLDPNRAFRGVYEYRVVTQEGERLNLQPVKVSTGMPDVGRAYVRPGVPGCRADVLLGARVLVGFVDADPGRPVVLGFEDAEGDGFKPTTLNVDATNVNLGAAAGRVLREGDTLTLTGVQAGTSATGVTATVTLGLGGLPSRVKA